MTNPHLVKQIKTESPSSFVEMLNLHHNSESFATMDYEIDIKYEDIEEPYMKALMVPLGLSTSSRQFKSVCHHLVGGPACGDDCCASQKSTSSIAQCSPLQCSRCTAIFDNKEKLREHVALLHTQYSPNHNCTLCDKCFDGPDADLYMELHMFFKHGMKTYKCTICDFISYDASEIFEHVTKHYPNKRDLTFFKMLSCITRPLSNCYIQPFSQCGKTARNVVSDSAAAVMRPETVPPTTHSLIGNTILNQPSISSNLQSKDNTGCNFTQNQTTGSEQVISPFLEKGYANLSQNIPHCKEVPKSSHFESTVPGNTKMDMYEEDFTPNIEFLVDDSVWEGSFPVNKSKTRKSTAIFIPGDVAPSMNTLEEPISILSCSKDVLASPSPSDLNNVQRNSSLKKNLIAVSNSSSSGNKVQSLKRPRENSCQDSATQSKHLCSEASSYDSVTQSEQHRSEASTQQTQDFIHNPKNPDDSSLPKGDAGTTHTKLPADKPQPYAIQKTGTVASNDSQDSLGSFKEQLDRIERLVRGNVGRLHTLENEIKRVDAAKKSPVCVLPSPASSLAELGALLEHPSLREGLLQQCAGPNVFVSCRLVMRRLMKRDLAIRFSLTGMGEKRLRTKESFREHAIFGHFYEVVSTLHPDKQSSIILGITRALKGAIDWQGGRAHRRNKTKDGAPPYHRDA